MRSTGFRIAIVNPLTLIGREIQSILNERGIPYARMELIDTTGKTAGALTAVNDEAAFVSDASEEAFLGLDLVFFCGPSEANATWIRHAADHGVLTVDLGEHLTSEDEVPIVAGINEERLADREPALSPHPIAVPIAILLQQLVELPLELCAVSVIQPASDLGQPGVDELYQQTINALNMQSIPKEVFDRQLAFNLYPARSASQLEELIVSQVEQILSRKVPVTLSVTQGTTFHGHSFSIFLRFSEPLANERLRGLLARENVIELADEDEDFSTIDAAGRDEILVGRVQRDRRIAGAFWIWAVADNVRRGAALNGVMLAETMLARFGEQAN